MDTIKINLNAPITNILGIDYDSMRMNNDGNIVVKLSDIKTVIGLSVGQTLSFKRYITDKNGNIVDHVTSFSEILEINGDEIIISNLNEQYYEIDEVYSGYTEGSQVGIFVRLKDKHNIFLQDFYNDDKITPSIRFHDKKREQIDNRSYEIYLTLKREDRIVESGDCITGSYILNECATECDNEIFVNEYEYCPEPFSRNSFIVKDCNLEDLKGKAEYVTVNHTPFYYIKDDEIHIKSGDTIFSKFKEEEENSPCIKYENKTSSTILFGVDSPYFNLGFGLSSDSNENELGSEDLFNGKFVEDLKESLVPNIIDMERLKYSPALYENELFNIATSITLSFHFRKRAVMPIEESSSNTPFTSGNTYYDSWHIDEDKEPITWWNGFDFSGSAFSSIAFAEYYNESGETSDLIGYLNFNDNDVYFRKKKISKSFIRLSFFNSNNPIEQKLLFYSTVFLDGGTLYGKYLKQLLAINSGEIVMKEGSYNENCKVVFCNSKISPVDTKIVITNEYDRTKSSEGFNIYLFAEDKNYNVDENGVKTIYMKVEFNHAGNGKTIPMIMWPKDEEGNFTCLNTTNFFDSLYIPVELRYINNERYIYSIPDAKNENGNISLILFEPKLDALVDTL